MAGSNDAAKVKTIVVPRALEEFFAEKLRTRYAQRADVQVVIDRRDHDRRAGGDEILAENERRRVDRRVLAGWWSLPDLPFENEKAS
jgi:hypothetical protein